MEEQIEEYRRLQREKFNATTRITNKDITPEICAELDKFKSKNNGSKRRRINNNNINSNSDTETFVCRKLPRIFESDRRIDWLLGRETSLPSSASSNRMDDQKNEPVVIIGECYETLPTLCSTYIKTCHNQFRLLSWNVDGLDDNGLIPRTKSIIQTILVTQPDIVYLQEVVEHSFEFYGEYLSKDFHIICPDERGGFIKIPSYFCVLMLRKDKWEIHEEPATQWFPTSEMGRHLLGVKCSLLGQSAEEQFLFMTSHLESTKDYAAERQSQLLNCLERMLRSNALLTVFGGDLNVRDSEIHSVMQLLENEKKLSEWSPVDVWTALGSDLKTKYTWDLKINDNKDFGAKGYKPRLFFLNKAIDNTNNPSPWMPTKLQLVGNWRLQTGRFPSDHFGLLTEFESTPKPQN